MNERITFPPFQLDLVAGRLSCGSKPVDLPPKAFRVLRYLAERAGQLIRKEDLLDAIWPDVHVGADVLKVTISEIRKALDDTCRAPRFIETAHRRGYRFIARTDAPAPIPMPHAGVPPTRYARNGDVNIAYQVLGEGDRDLVFVMGWVSHLDYFWTEPTFARFLRRLSKFSRLILFDKRGSGLSDRVPLDGLPTLEQRMDDVRAVLDAVGSKRAALCGVSEGGALAALFAATHPERTSALVMIGSYAKRLRDSTYPWGPTLVEREAFLTEIANKWGGPVGIEDRAPSMAADPEFRRWWAAYLRTSASPAAAVALTRMNSEADIRSVLPAIRVPTLVVHRTGDRCLLVDEGRYLASRIPGARFVELPGIDHLPFVGDQDAIIDQVEEFLNGARPAHRGKPVLATTLSASFELAKGESQPTAREWLRLRQYIVRELQFHRGSESNQGADTLLATFDGPARAIRCAWAIGEHASRMGIRFRAGLHTGECEVTASGIRGTAVETARQIARSAAVGEILVSAAVRDLVAGSGITFQCKETLSYSELPILSVESACPYPSLSERLQAAASA